MPVTTIDSTGGDATWIVRQNCVWRTDCQLFDGNNPVDITGATITAWITAASTDNTPLKTFTATVLDAADGRWSIDIADTDADLDVGSYWWAMEVDLGIGDEPLCSGKFIVEPWVIAP